MLQEDFLQEKTMVHIQVMFCFSALNRSLSTTQFNSKLHYQTLGINSQCITSYLKNTNLKAFFT